MVAANYILILQIIFITTFLVTWSCLFLYDQIIELKLALKQKKTALFLKNSGIEQYNSLLEQNARLKDLLNGEIEGRN